MKFQLNSRSKYLLQFKINSSSDINSLIVCVKGPEGPPGPRGVVGREGLEGPPGADGQFGQDGNKGVKVRTVHHTYLMLTHNETHLRSLFSLSSGGTRRRRSGGLSWKTWTAW